MQWKVSLLVCVAIASGFMSLIHLYLLSTSSHQSISVAVEIPLGQALHPQSTNLELNIKSVSDRDKQSVDQNTHHVDRQVQIDTLNRDTIGATGHSKSNTQSLNAVQYSAQPEHIPLIHKEENNVLGEEEKEGVLREDSEDYTVLFDTGDYELVEKDIDQVIEDPIKSRPSKKLRHGKAVKQHLQPQHHPPTKMETHLTGRYISSEPVDNSVPAKEHNVNDRVQEEHVEMAHDTPNGTVSLLSEEQLQEKEKVKPKVVALTKEEYYARQATLDHQVHPTHPPPKTAPPHHTATGCTVLPCLQYLSLPEKNIYKKCQKKATPHKASHSPPTCQCKFRDGAGKKRVALVSLPGSGNTWLRGLLEKATGVCTGNTDTNS